MNDNSIEWHRAHWAGIAKEHGWYVEPFYVQVWRNKSDGTITDSVSVKGMTQDIIVDNVPEFREVDVQIHGDDYTMSALVAVGDGTDYDPDEDDEFDERVFYYFRDEAEFQEAVTTGTEYFRVITESK